MKAITRYKTTIKAMIKIDPVKAAVLDHVVVDLMTVRQAAGLYGIPPSGTGDVCGGLVHAGGVLRGAAMMRPFFSYYGSKWRVALSYPAPFTIRLLSRLRGQRAMPCAMPIAK